MLTGPKQQAAQGDDVMAFPGMNQKNGLLLQSVTADTDEIETVPFVDDVNLHLVRVIMPRSLLADSLATVGHHNWKDAAIKKLAEVTPGAISSGSVHVTHWSTSPENAMTGKACPSP